MAVIVRFNEGADRVLTSGLPATSTFALDRNPIAVDLLAPDPGDIFADSGYADRLEATGTGYAPIAVATPASVDGIVEYPIGTINWQNFAAVDWPTDIKTLILYDATLHLWLFGWDLRSMLNGGANLDMSAANSRITNDTASFHIFLE